MRFSDIRTEYTLSSLNESDVDSNPIVQCQKWLEEVVIAKFPHPNAMMLTTADPNTLQPSARIVLLKDLDEQGFYFYTNSLSHKGKEIAANPKVSLSFYWDVLERQIHVQGEAHIVPAELSDAYFAKRPRDAQISTWASQQSEIVPDRAYLDKLHQQWQVKFANQPVPRPPHWHGYCVVPNKIEFWQGRAGRLHDRLCYQRNQDRWQIVRLAP